MAETLHHRRSGFIVPGEQWLLRPHRPAKESKRIVKWPTGPNPKKESAKPTQSVVGFMKWMRHLMDIVEAQRNRSRKDLASMAIRRSVRKIR